MAHFKKKLKAISKQGKSLAFKKTQVLPKERAPVKKAAPKVKVSGIMKNFSKKAAGDSSYAKVKQ